MRYLLVGINAKFIHSSLAVHYLASYVKGYLPVSTLEFTINQNEDFILREIFRYKPDVLCFSCYIWNIGLVQSLCGNLKKILPQLFIVLGGPEASYNSHIFQQVHCDTVIVGEGEQTFLELLTALEKEADWKQVPGVAFEQDGVVHHGPERPLMDMDQLVFPYTEGLRGFENKIIYYEASRGCPFSCGYCLSSVEKGVRFMPVQRVYQELGFFLRHKVKQVKFVDRTFNCNKMFAMDIWQYLIDHDNGVTNFHFEIAADLLTEDQLKLLSVARPGLFQMEIGVQSTNKGTLDQIHRKSQLDRLFQNVILLQQPQNIHIHLDLIAGLPGENYASFQRSFNQVYSLRPDQLQLGFLKLLHGSKLCVEAETNGLVYREKAPYEILYTKDLSFEYLLKLKGVEEMVEIFYNSGFYPAAIRYVEQFYSQPFDLYYALWCFYEEKEYHHISHKKIQLYYFLFLFMDEKLKINSNIIMDLLKFDLYANENVKNKPEWMDNILTEDDKNRIKLFYREEQYAGLLNNNSANYTSRQMQNINHIDKFYYNILAWLNGTEEKLEQDENFVLFTYGKLKMYYDITKVMIGRRNDDKERKSKAGS